MTIHQAAPGAGRARRTAALLAATAATTLVAGAFAAVPAVAAPTPTAVQALPSAVPADLPELSIDDPSINWAEILVDGDDVERRDDGTPYNVFNGFGAVSCNNTGNLLLDYKEENPEAYWRIMHMLFDKETGAGLSHIKVELGADNNTSSGAEPATKRSQDEPANVLRGAGFHFIADALTINPDIKTEALRWGEPSWTGTNLDLRYQWYKETIDAAYDTYGVKFDYMSPSQNEVHANYINSELAWTIDFAQRLELDAAAEDARYDYSDIKIVALDSYRNVEAVARAILASPAALEQIDAIGYHYDIDGGPNLTRLNKEFGMEVLYSEGVSPMIEPEYRITSEPNRGGIGGTVGAVDIVDRYINAYRWSGAGANPAHMTSFLFQPAVSAMYEGTQYLPKSLIRASDPWSGYYEGGVGITLVRHFTQFAEHGWEYIEGATYGDGAKGDGGTQVDTSTRTYMTLRTPASDAGEPEFTQVQANNTATARYFEVKVADLGEPRPLYVWETKGPDAGEAVDANHFQNIGYLEPVRTETIDGTEHAVYRVEVKPYSIRTLSTLATGVYDSAESTESGHWASDVEDSILPLPYTDDFDYADYADTTINGVTMDYITRRGGSPRYTADQNGAFEVIKTDDGAVLQQAIHANNRGYTWNVWGNGTQNNPSTANPATVLGEHRWANYTASIDFRLDTNVRNASLANFAGLGVRQVVAEGEDLATYAARVFADGSWQLRKLGTVVASGTAAGFDANAWHTLDVEAKENRITVTLDDTVLTSYLDGAANPVMAGRIAILSGYYNTQYDNLAVTPIEGYAWASEKIDDANARIGYPGGFSYSQAGYAHHNRTQHVLSTGRSFTLDFNGTGLNFNGWTAAATLDVVIDDEPVRAVTIGGGGNRQTSYWLRGLSSGDHTVTATVRSGTFTLDSIDVLVGGADVPVVSPAERPISVNGTLPRQAVAPGSTPELPATVSARSQAGTDIDAAVDWAIVPSAFQTPYALVRVDGTFVNNPSLAVTAYVEVVPENVVYFVDANGPATANAAYPLYADWATTHGGALRNATADAAWNATAGWGRTATHTAKGLLNQTPYNKLSESGWYSAGSSTPIDYRFTLPAGTYTVATGHYEWWAVGSGKTRNLTGSVLWTADGATQTVQLGSRAWPNSSLGASVQFTGDITLTEETIITVRVAGTGGTEAAVLSYIGIAGDEAVAPTDLAFTTEVAPRCVAAKPQLAVRVVNDEAFPIAVTVTTPYGSIARTVLEPGANVYRSYVVRTATPGTVTVTATTTEGEPRETVHTEQIAAPSC